MFLNTASVPLLCGDETDAFAKANRRARRNMGVGMRRNIKRGYRRRLRHMVNEALRREMVAGGLDAN